MKRILVLAEDPFVRASLVDALRGQGHELIAVETTADTLKKLSDKPALFVYGSRLPDGMETIRQANRAGVPVVLHLPSPELVALEASLSRVGIPIAGRCPAPLDPRQLPALLQPLHGQTPPKDTDLVESWSGLEFLRTVEGSLENFPVMRVLFLAFRLEATGIVELRWETFSSLLGLHKGRVVHVEGVPFLLRGLDPRLPDQHHLTRDVESAVAAGHAVDRVLHTAAEGLGQFLARRMSSKGHIRFQSEYTPPAGHLPLPLSIPRFIAVGLKAGRTNEAVERTWTARMSSNLRIRLPTDVPEARWGLDPTATRVLRTVQRQHNLTAVLSSIAGESTSRRLEVFRALDLLHALGLLIIDGGPMEIEQTVSLRTREVTEEDPRVNQLRTALAAMEEQHPIDILELNGRTDLTEDDISSAYRGISRRYHPDYFFSAPAVLKSLAEACFARVNAAYESLRSSAGLTEANLMLNARARGTQYVTEKDYISARIAFRKGEILYRNRDWKGALPLFEEAYHRDKETWPYALYYVRCAYLSHTITADEAIAQLDNIKPGANPKLAELKVAIGNILKQEGRIEEALRTYNTATFFDPENHDAQRELRLHQRRSRPTEAASGFWDSLMGRKKE